MTHKQHRDRSTFRKLTSQNLCDALRRPLKPEHPYRWLMDQHNGYLDYITRYQIPGFIPCARRRKRSINAMWRRLYHVDMLLIEFGYKADEIL